MSPRAPPKAVREAAASCGYKVNLVARSLRMQCTNTLLLLAPCVDNPFYPSLVRAIEAAAHEQGFSVIIGFTLKNPDSRSAYGDLISNGRVDGVILIDGGVGIQDLTGLRPPIPTVQALDQVLAPSVPVVKADDHYVAELALRHLAGLGHRRIAHLSGAPSALPSVQRQEGYRDTMAALGLPVEDGYIQCGITGASRPWKPWTSSWLSGTAPPPCSAPTTRWPAVPCRSALTAAFACPETCQLSARATRPMASMCGRR